MIEGTNGDEQDTARHQLTLIAAPYAACSPRPLHM
jgi:hypothetical protein